MSNHDRRLSRRDAEEILASPAQSDHAVGPLLDALGAPGREGELLREDAAVAAFHAARLGAVPTSRSDSTVSKPTRTAAKAFLATGAVVALTSGGLALAATGHLPSLPDQASDRATEAVAKHATESPSETTTTTATETATTATTTESATEVPSETPTESPETEAAPTPNLEGLCNAFQHGNRTEKGKSLDSAAFAALATAAGGKDAIATYCVSLIGEPEAQKTKPAKPTQAATPTKPAKPTQAATPTKPAKPTTPAKPTNPVLPTKASNPTKPVKTAGGKPEGVGKR